MNTFIKFPDLHLADENGLIAIGGSYSSNYLISAYQQGIFPWPLVPDYPYAWFSPNPRGILVLNDLHLSKKVNKEYKKNNFKFVFNQNFLEIITNCKNVKRKNQSSTWITNEIISGYCDLFDNQKAYCLGVYSDQKLVAGLYGVVMGTFISGESMFTLIPDGSKLALAHLLLHLKNKKMPWIDIQMVTPVLKNFGGKYIEREEYKKLIHPIDWNEKTNIFT